MLNNMKQLLSLAWSTAAGVAMLSLTTAGASAQATLIGCYVPNSGTVYRIKAPGLPDACKGKSHVEFTWSLQGPQGPTGLTGPRGPEGPAGPAGGLSVSAIEVVTGFTELIPSGGRAFLNLSCPTGMVATGGGGRSEGNVDPLRLLASIPNNVSGLPAGWHAEFENPNSVSTRGEVWAVCVKAGP